jgi:hypothetical protein
MDDYTVYVNDVDRNLYLPPESLDITRAVQDQSTVTLELIDTSGAWRPELNDVIRVVKDERSMSVTVTSGSANISVSGGTLATVDEGMVFRIPGAGLSGGVLVSRLLTRSTSTTGILEFEAETSGTFTSTLGKWLIGAFISTFDEDPFYADVGNRFSITAQDFNAYPGRILINTYWLPGVMVKDVMIVMADTLNFAFGTRLDPATLDGPTLTELYYSPWRNGREVMEYMMGLAGWTWQITPDNVLRPFPPSELELPEMDSMTPVEGTCKVIREFSEYRNDQRVFFGGTGEGDFTQRFFGDGGTRVWTLTGQPILAPLVPALPRPIDYTWDDSDPPVALIPYMNVFRNGIQTLEDIGLPGSGEKWTWNFATNQITHDSGEAVLDDATDDYVEFVYRTTFPLVVGAGNAGGVAEYGFFSRADEAPDIKDEQVAQAYAEYLIATHSEPITRLVFTTYDETYAVPGARIPVNLPNRGLGGIDFTIISVNTYDDGAYNLLYTIEAVEGDAYRERGIDFWRQPNPSGPRPIEAPEEEEEGEVPEELQFKGAPATNATSADVTFDIAPNVGNLALLFVSRYSGSQTPSVSDNQGNTWTKRVGTNPGNGCVDIWTAPIVTASGPFTVTHSTSGGEYRTLVLAEIAGADTSNPNHSSIQQIKSGASLQTAEIPDTTVPCRIYGACTGQPQGTTMDPGTGWTQLYEFDQSNGVTQGISVIYKDAPTPGTHHPEWSTSSHTFVLTGIAIPAAP